MFGSGRWALNAEYAIMEKKITMFHFHEGYLGFEDTDDLYIKSQQGMRFTIIKDFYTSIQVNMDYDNTPSPGLDRIDTTMLFGLGYNFSF